MASTCNQNFDLVILDYSDLIRKSTCIVVKNLGMNLKRLCCNLKGADNFVPYEGGELKLLLLVYLSLAGPR